MSDEKKEKQDMSTYIGSLEHTEHDKNIEKHKNDMREMLKQADNVSAKRQDKIQKKFEQGGYKPRRT